MTKGTQLGRLSPTVKNKFNVLNLRKQFIKNKHLVSRLGINYFFNVFINQLLKNIKVVYNILGVGF